MCIQFFQSFQLFCKGFISHGALGCLGNTAFQNFHIGEDELQVDGFDIAERIDAAVYMDNIWILKATDNVYDRVYLTDISKELVSKTFALGSALYQTSDINELDHSRSDFGRIIKSC